MARTTRRPEAEGLEPVHEDIPIWQQQSVDRSLQSARLRAQQQTDRYVSAAIELLDEREDLDWTLQDVVNQAGTSLKTFYRFFDSKDSLQLAVYETILSKTAVPMLRERCAAVEGPVERLKTLLEAMAQFATESGPPTRALAIFHLRLAETRPHDLVHAMKPLQGFISELLTGVAAAGRLRTDLDVATLAALLQEMLLASVHSLVFTGRQRTSTDDLWAFCSAAVLKEG